MFNIGEYCCIVKGLIFLIVFNKVVENSLGKYEIGF